MRDGYYLATYLTPPGLARVASDWLRHDNNVSLWELSGSAVKLCRYWELERFTGVKEDGTALLKADDVRTMLDGLLESEGLSLADIAEIWGTPGIATVDDYHLVDDVPDIAYGCRVASLQCHPPGYGSLL